MERTLDIMAGQDTAPTETPTGGTLSTDFSEQLILLGNRLSALETSINRLSKLIEPEQDSPDNTTEAEPEQDRPDNTTAEPEQDSPDDNTEAEPESPAESEE